ncbi:MAG TPA: PAS domain-containing protein [Polyangiaceae bacterium]
MSNAVAVSNNVTAYLAKARERARQTGGDITAFSERVRSLATEPQADADPRDAELAVAVEELRTQNEELGNACRMLERERAKYVSMFSNAPDAYVTTNARGIITEANAAAGLLLGMEAWFLAGKLLIAFVARQDVHGFRQHLKDVASLRNGSSSTFSARMRTRGAPVFAGSLSVRAMRAEDGGDVVGHLWLLRRATTPDGTLRPALAALAEVAGLARGGSAADGLPGRERVSLAEVLATAVEQAAPLAVVRGVRFAPDGPREDLLVDANPARLRQAMHLLTRLATSSAPEGGALHVRIASTADEVTLELAADGADGLDGSDGEILAIAAHLVADAGRLDLPEEPGTSLLCRVTWPRADAR